MSSFLVHLIFGAVVGFFAACIGQFIADWLSNRRK